MLFEDERITQETSLNVEEGTTVLPVSALETLQMDLGGSMGHSPLISLFVI
jgi:hypothetical protein